MEFRTLRWSRARAALGVALLSVVLQASSCPDADLAKQKARREIELILDQLDRAPRNWRVHWKLLKKDTKVSSFDFFSTGDLDAYTCRGWCVMFFLDLNPYAHFAHPTRILVFDSKPADESKPIVVLPPTEWWPTIRESTWSYPRSVFNTVAAREDPMQVFILDLPPEELPLPKPPLDFDLKHTVWRRSLATDSSGGPPPVPTPPATGDAPALICDAQELPAWAILVNGFYDDTDTFDEDIVGMYSVLRGFDVHDDRIICLSPFKLFDSKNCVKSTLIELENSFKSVRQEMEKCSEELPASAEPHFLLFWSSHGGENALACDLSDDIRELVFGSKLNDFVTQLEGEWMAPDSATTRLETTIVIEACKSGSVGETLHTGGGHRRILTSARDENSVSYRDIDENVGGMKDPNPADAGSETIWGYVEAFGDGSVDTGGEGTISFDEALEYVKDNDVTILGGLHDIKFWEPSTTDSIPVHGASNTSTKAATSVAFSAPASTATASFTAPVTTDVVPGQTVKLEVEIKNQGGVPENGALALRFFRNDETADEQKWDPKYYEDDNLRTTLMIPGLTASQSIPLGYEVDIPSTFQEGDTLRVVVALDSGQKPPPPTETGAALVEPKSEIILKVKKKCKSICCWWKNLWN